MRESIGNELELFQDDKLAGFRLHRLEALNWGTFDRQVWTLQLNGKNALLTGEIGSGKSTLADAVTTLLVPAHRVAFNKAAGAEKGERTLRSYVLGYYKSERNETTGSGKPVALRTQSDYSVILGVFRNAGYEQTITLAQVFWMKELHGQPERFYVIREGELTIAADFAQFKDMVSLRKRLRAPDVKIFDSYPPYGALFRRLMGIKTEQALELFHQTVSMKSVGNLTDFVRGHMLEPFDTALRVQALVSHFDDLNRAHEAVLKAKRQVERLQPLVADCDRYEELEQTVHEMRNCRDTLKACFAQLKLELLKKRLRQLSKEHAQHDAAVQRLEAQRRAGQNWLEELQRDIAQNGGDRLERIAEEIRQLEVEKDSRMRRADRYATFAQELGLHPAETPDIFLEQQSALKDLREDAAQREAKLQNAQSEETVEFAQRRQERDALVAEITSLKARRSNIDSRQISMRSELCRAIGVSEEQMPFVGELLQVREEERDWEGAIERYLHNFGLSLLVPDERYAQVAEWVDKTHLQNRLVYYRVRAKNQTDLSATHADALAQKISIKPDSVFYPWLEHEIAHRCGDMICCATQELFRRTTKAITRAGQIKSTGERHEKDDRYRLDDRSRYVLGWSNAEKITALETAAKTLEDRLAQIAARLARLQAEQNALKARLEIIAKMEEFQNFPELDWHPLVLRIDALQEEKKQLETTSDVLAQLKSQLDGARASLKASEEQLEKQRDARSRIAQKKSDAEELQSQTQELLDETALTQLDACKDKLAALRQESLGAHQLTIESCDNREQDTRKFLQGKIDAEDVKINRLREKIVNAMSSYHADFPLETQEADVSVEAAGEYRGMLAKLASDDLPRFEARFKDLLNENTIREVASFHAQLARERETIKERIARINESLTKIQYNEGRYIKLEEQLTQDSDVRDFQGELKTCTEGSLTGSEDDQYSEAKFLQVKSIIERFRGREGRTEMDARWTTKVTDVRNWFVFAASERWREDDTEYEHYSDSGGKSGGQKEKLAYTVLAASLAYQFGLEWGEVRSRSFRFVVIDEAFGRGSDESAQYGLQLFSQLNLQFLIVTPLQKIHIIEPFVANVGFVHNADGRDSKLRNLSIEEYREEKARESE